MKGIKKQSGRGGMIDVSQKGITKRVAIARARLKMNIKTLKVLLAKGSPKGDVLETAKIAGILAAKKTPQIIPLCHPLNLRKVEVSFQPDRKKGVLTILAEVVCLDQTGVEMEALTAVCAAALTVYDMMKWLDKKMVLADCMLLHKSGGRSGHFERKVSDK